jgi:hypothetical protein
MGDQPDKDRANSLQATPVGLDLPDDLLAKVEAAAAAAKEKVKDSMVDVNPDRTGQLTPPLTPRHRRRPKF